MIASGIAAPPCQDSWAAVSCPTNTCWRAVDSSPRQEARLRTPICERLDIEFPIFAFSHCRDVVAAVSKAGGYGVLGALAYSPEQLEIELNWIDEHVDGKPYGVDIVMPAKYVGKGGGAEASRRHLHELIPPEHRQFVDELLDEYDIPPLPEELERAAW